MLMIFPRTCWSEHVVRLYQMLFGVGKSSVSGSGSPNKPKIDVHITSLILDFFLQVHVPVKFFRL